MKRIGLLGGMSWESTAEYYRLINGEVARRLGGLHSANLVLASVDFAEIEHLQAEGRWDEAGDALAAEAAALQAAGAEFVVICTNTMHIVADQVQDAIAVPVLNLIDVVAQRLRRDQRTRVGVLGTAFSMEHGFYRDRLAHHGIEVVVPNREDRAEVHRVIYEELCRGQILDGSRHRYEEVIHRLADQGVQGTILGCTEIELLLTASHVGTVPLYPTTRLHAHAAVDHALSSFPAT